MSWLYVCLSVGKFSCVLSLSGHCVAEEADPDHERLLERNLVVSGPWKCVCPLAYLLFIVLVFVVVGSGCWYCIVPIYSRSCLCLLFLMSCLSCISCPAFLLSTSVLLPVSPSLSLLKGCAWRQLSIGSSVWVVFLSDLSLLQSPLLHSLSGQLGVARLYLLHYGWWWWWWWCCFSG